MSEQYELLSAPVAGGELAVGKWNRGAARTVLAFHGVTASHQSWRAVARAFSDSRFVAPDLRGRGGSRELGRPFGMAQHAADAVAALDFLGSTDRVDLLGHSMGGFVAMRFAADYPERVRSITLIDGGIPLALPSDVPIEEVMKASLGPALARLQQTFPSREAYREFWRTHPAFVGNWSEDVEAYVDYDLVGTEPQLRASANGDAVLADSLEQGVGTVADEPWESVRGPITFLRARRGMLNQPEGLYPAEYVTDFASRHPNLHVIEVPDVNHYTIVMNRVGADAVVAATQERSAP
jgi:pimeloyl-ACP methyl ester carboxylesterase